MNGVSVRSVKRGKGGHLPRLSLRSMGLLLTLRPRKEVCYERGEAITTSAG